MNLITFDKLSIFQTMAGKLLVTCLRLNSRVVPSRMMSSVHEEVPFVPPYVKKIGKREIVGFGMNGEPHYMDLWDYPFPSIRFKEMTPDLEVKNKLLDNKYHKFNYLAFDFLIGVIFFTKN